MKLATYDRPIERMTTAPERAFTIKATGKAFRILSSGLYTNKVLAIVRELSCNAHDAHVAAGKRGVPFEVHLPSRFETWFSVRDYGKALSPEQITSVFTVYFESTKTDNNDEVGGLGLGCKSPLSYVDSFTVISRYEGVKRIYTVFFNEEDTPSIIEMSAEPSDEPTGLEVQLPVRAFDVYDFLNAAHQVYRYFETPPVVSGNADYKLNVPKVLLEGAGYRIVDRTENSSRAIMGVVSYPINASSVGHSENIMSVYGQNAHLDIDFKIGELDITAGREELSYDKRTKEALANRADAIVHDLTRRIIGEMKRAANEYEARKFYGAVVAPYSVVRDLFPEGKVPYRDGFISTSAFVLDTAKLFESGGEIRALEILSTRKTPKATIYSKNAGTSHTRIINIPARDELTFIDDDVNGRYLNHRTLTYMEQNKEHKVYVLRGLTDAEKQYLADTFPKATFILLSSLDKPQRDLAARKTPSVLRLNPWRKNSVKYARRDWERTEVDMDEGGVYVLMAGQVPEYNGNPVSEFSRIHNLATKMNLIPASQDLFAVSKTLDKRLKFSTHEGWVNLFDQIIENFRTKMAESGAEWAVGIARTRRMSEFGNLTHSFKGNGERILSSVAQKLPAEHPLAAFRAGYQECSTGRIGAEDPSDLARLLGIMLPQADAPDVSRLWQAIDFEKKYPLAQYVFESLRYSYSSVDTSRHAEQVHEYIQLCDKNCTSSEP